MVKNWRLFNESVESDEYYEYSGSPIYVRNIYSWGAEYKLDIVYPDGKRSSYIGDKKDIEEDFTPTDKTFDILPEEEKKLEPKPKPKKEIEERFNLVFYIGKQKVSIIRRNLDKKLAYALRGAFSKDPNYRGGDLKVEIIR